MADTRRRMVARRNSRTAQPRPVMATIVSVDTTAGYAVAELPDGTQFQSLPQAGYLPAVGDTVSFTPNGGDMVGSSPRHMVDGDLQSKDFVAGVSGWRITAEGDLEANDGLFRGEIVANPFKTASDFTVDGGIEVSSTDGVNTMIFRRAGTLETDPARISAEEVGGVRFFNLEAPGVVSGIYMREGATDDDRWVDVRSPNLLSGGISVNHPPSRKVLRTSHSLADATITSIIPSGTVYHNVLMDGTDAVDLNTFDGSLTPKVPGRWRLAVTALWGNSGDYAAHVGYRWNGTTDFWMTKTNPNQLETPDGQHPAEFSDVITVDGSTDYITLRAYHTAGAARNFAIRGCLLEYISDT